MGYDLQRFKDEVSEEFICSICTGVLKDPVITPECDHTFCRACISDWLNVKQQCPIDNALVKLEDLRSVPRIIKNLLAKLLISCDYASNGCSIFVKTEDLDAHVKECAYNPTGLVPCEKNCGINILRGAVNDHNCVKELRKCLDAIKLQYQAMKEKIIKLNEEHTKSTAEYAKLAEEHTKLAEEHTQLIERQTKLEEDHAISTSEHIKQAEELKKLAEEHAKLIDKQTRLEEEHKKLEEEHKKLEEEHTKSYSELKQELNHLKQSLEFQISSTKEETKTLHELRTVQESTHEAQEKEEHLKCEKSHLRSNWWEKLPCWTIDATDVSFPSPLNALYNFLNSSFASRDFHKFVLCGCGQRSQLTHNCGLEKLFGLQVKIRCKCVKSEIISDDVSENCYIIFILKFENTHVPNDLIPKCGFAFQSNYRP